MQLKPTIRKQRADSVRYGPNIARGPYVYCAYDADKLIAVGATVDEARRNYRRAWAAELAKGPTREGWVKS
jgi:hypothetical protein